LEINEKRPTRPLSYDDVMDENVYENVWLFIGDDKVTDVSHLLQQNRLTKY